MPMLETNGASGADGAAKTIPRVDGNGVRPAVTQVVTEAGPARPALSRKTIGAEQFCLSLRMLWKKRALVLCTTGVFTGAAIGISFLIPPRYASTTRLLPAPRSSPVDSTMQKLRPEIGALAGLTSIAETSNSSERFIALLKSSVVAERIVQRFELKKLYHTRLRADARAALAEHTAIQEDRRTGIIAVTVVDGSPERAARMAAGYAEELERFSIQMNATGAHLERQFLEGRVKELATELSDATGQLSAFSTSSGLMDAKEQPVGLMQQATRLEAAIIELKAELSAQEQIYAAEALKSPRARLAELERRLKALHGKGGVSAELAAERDQPSIRNLPTLGVTFTDLARRVKLLEGVQAYLSEKLELAKIEEVKQLPSFRVMEPAEVPELRIWPKRKLIVAAAFAAGLLVSLLSVFLSVTWNSTDMNHPVKVLVLDVYPGVRHHRFPDASH